MTRVTSERLLLLLGFSGDLVLGRRSSSGASLDQGRRPGDAGCSGEEGGESSDSLVLLLQGLSGVLDVGPAGAVKVSSARCSWPAEAVGPGSSVKVRSVLLPLLVRRTMFLEEEVLREETLAGALLSWWRPSLFSL